MSELSLWESTVTVPFDFQSNRYVASLSDGRVLLSGSLNTSGDFAREFLTMNADGSVSRALTDVFTGEGSSMVTAALANGNFVTCFASDFSGERKLYWYLYNNDGDRIKTGSQGRSYSFKPVVRIYLITRSPAYRTVILPSTTRV